MHRFYKTHARKVRGPKNGVASRAPERGEPILSPTTLQVDVCEGSGLAPEGRGGELLSSSSLEATQQEAANICKKAYDKRHTMHEDSKFLVTAGVGGLLTVLLLLLLLLYCKRKTHHKRTRHVSYQEMNALYSQRSRPAGTTAEALLTPGDVLGDGKLKVLQEVARDTQYTTYTGSWRASKGPKGKAEPVIVQLMNDVDNDIDEAEKQEMVQTLQEEVAVLQHIRHENILTFFGCVPVSGAMALVFERTDGGTLFELLRGPDSLGLRQRHSHGFALDIASAMEYLHSQSPAPILHRDLKSPSVRVTGDFRAKLTDFGMVRSKALSDAGRTALMSSVGSPFWCAPEIFLGKVYNEKVDVYSYAILLWELHTGLAPWQEHPSRVAYMVAQEGKRCAEASRRQ